MEAERIDDICRAFGRINRCMMHSCRRMLELGQSEAGVLWIIGRSGKEGIYPAEVSRKMSMARPSLTPILRELEKRDLIRRVPDPADGRRCILLVTERFWEEHRERQREDLRLMEQLLDGFSADEVESLSALLHKIEQALPDRYEERFSKEDKR